MPLQRLLTMFLVAGITVCCCQARVLLGSGNGDNCCIEEVVEVDIPSCCAAQPEAAPVQNETGDTNNNPDGKCDCCCVKATTANDATSIESPAVSAAYILPPSAIVVVDHEESPLRLIAGRFDRVEPPTLLRLRCALII